VDSAKGLATHEAFQPFNAERELAGGKRPLC
jgi:hypothetical protein